MLIAALLLFGDYFGCFFDRLFDSELLCFTWQIQYELVLLLIIVICTSVRNIMKFISIMLILLVPLLFLRDYCFSHLF